MSSKYKPVVLAILDGFGIAPPSEGNAVSQARKPVFDELVRYYPRTIIQASGEEVGLPKFAVGNSEVGHMNLGSGRVMYQELPRIDKAISDGSFFKNEAFLKAVDHVKKYGSNLHLLGLVSSGGVHSHIRHVYALLKLAKQEKVKNVYIHAFTDGRDTPRKSGIDFISELETQIKKTRLGKIATISGRYWAMDRDRHWDRIKKTYDALVKGIGPSFTSAKKALKEAYAKEIYDEKVPPTVITENKKPIAQIKDNDAAIFFDFRSDRAKQLTQALTLPEFKEFERGEQIANLFFVTMTEYEKGLPVKIAFPTLAVINSMGEIISKAGLSQLRVAETEKYAHVTVFFNCGRIDPYPGEDRKLIASPPVASYDMQPEMSAHEITLKLIEGLDSKKYDFLLINYANPDMVGHTGNIAAAKRGIEKVDECLGKIVKKVLAQNGALIVTADHGNADVTINLITGEVDKEHSVNPVPFIVVAADKKQKSAQNTDLSLLSPIGLLSDVTPSLLELLGIEKPKEMTGISLLNLI